MRLGLRILGLRQLRVRAKFRQHFYSNRSIVFPTPNPVVTPTDCPVTSLNHAMNGKGIPLRTTILFPPPPPPKKKSVAITVPPIYTIITHLNNS